MGSFRTADTASGLRDYRVAGFTDLRMGFSDLGFGAECLSCGCTVFRAGPKLDPSCWRCHVAVLRIRWRMYRDVAFSWCVCVCVCVRARPCTPNSVL